MSITAKIKNRIVEVIGDQFGKSILCRMDRFEPTEDNPIVRFRLVSATFNGVGVVDVESYSRIKKVLDEAELTTEFDALFEQEYGPFEQKIRLLVVVTAMGMDKYIENGNCIYNAEELASRDEAEYFASLWK